MAMLAACGSSNPRSGTPPTASTPLSGTWTAPAILARVPAESPYVIGVVEPIPSSYRAQVYASANRKIAAAVRELEALPRDFDRSTLPPQTRAMYVVLDELRGKDISNWTEVLGFNRSGRFVLYGLGVWPVMRAEVGDAAKVRALAKRVIDASGVPVTESELQGRAYWSFSKHQITVVAAIVDTELVAAVIPTAALAKVLPTVLGLESPKPSMRDAGALSQTASKYSLLSTMVGYLDVRAAAGIVTQRTPSAIAELDAILLEATGAMSEDCRSEIDRLVDVVPRVVFGYQKLDAGGMHARMIAEMPPALAQAVMTLRARVPGVVPGRSGTPFGAFGVAANVDETIALLRRVTGHVKDMPFRCTWLTSLNEAAAALDARLAQPLPLGLGGVNGMSLVVDSFVKEPLDARGYAIISGAGAHDVVTKLMQFVPGTGGATLAPDGRPVALSVGMFGLPATVTAHAAATRDRAVIAIGAASDQRATEILAMPAPKRSPLVTFAMDVPAWDALELDEDGKDNDLEDMRDIVVQLDAIPEGLAIDMFGTFTKP